MACLVNLNSPLSLYKSSSIALDSHECSCIVCFNCTLHQHPLYLISIHDIHHLSNHKSYLLPVMFDALCIVLVFQLKISANNVHPERRSWSLVTYLGEHHLLMQPFERVLDCRNKVWSGCISRAFISTVKVKL